MREQVHRGRKFELWMAHEAWLWRVFDVDSHCAAIGAAVSEAQAIHEACVYIEEHAQRALTDQSNCHSRLTNLLTIRALMA
jgi:hypothetical protein